MSMYSYCTRKSIYIFFTNSRVYWVTERPALYSNIANLLCTCSWLPIYYSYGIVRI